MNRPPELDLPPEPGEDSPFTDVQPPLLDVHQRIPFVLTEDALELDGQAEVSYGRGKIPGTAAVAMLLRVPVSIAEDAAACDHVLHGALSLYAAREDAKGSKVQRVEFATTMDFTLCEVADTGEVGEPIRFQASLSSLTLSATEGGCVLTVGVRWSPPVSALMRLDGLGRSRCRLVGRAMQQTLPLDPA